MTATTARRTVWPPSKVITSLRCDHRMLHASQKLFRLSQRQPEIGDIAKTARPTELHHIDTLRRVSHAIHHPPAGNCSTGHIASVQIPNPLDILPRG
jgi:hypothetical protein